MGNGRAKMAKRSKTVARKFAFIMDPLERVLVDKDTTFVFMLEAQFRGHAIYFLGLRDLYARGRQVIARARQCELTRRGKPHYKFLDDGADLTDRPRLTVPKGCQDRAEDDGIADPLGCNAHARCESPLGNTLREGKERPILGLRRV